MAVEVAKLIAKLEADVADFDRDMKKATGRLDQLEDKAGKAGKSGQSAFSGMGGAVKAFATGAAVLKTAQFFKDTIDASSDLNESINAVQVTFGDAADGILELGKNAATAVGLSNSEFNSLAVGFSAFVEKIDGGRGDVVGVMEDLTGRISDFASVMNLEVPDAAEKFRAGLAGETEPLRQFGIDVSAAAVNAKALELGLGGSSGALTEQDKILARYHLIMDQTAKTAGDFANTSDQLANSQRILKAEFENAKAEIGDALTPVMTNLIGTARDLLPAFKDMAGSFANLIASAEPFIQLVAQGLGIAFKTVGTALDAVTGKLDLYAKAQENFVKQHGREASTTEDVVQALKEEADARYGISDAIFFQNAAGEKLAEGLVNYINTTELTADSASELINSLRDLKAENEISAESYDLVTDAIVDNLKASDDLTDVQRRDLAKALGVTVSQLKELEPQMRKVTKGFDEAGTSAKELEKRQKALQKELEDTGDEASWVTKQLDAMEQAMKNQVNPALAAIDSLADYQQALADNEAALARYGEGSEEAEAAGRNLLNAYQDLIADAKTYSEHSGKNMIESIRELGEKARLTEGQIAGIVAQLNEVDGFVASALLDIQVNVAGQRITAGTASRIKVGDEWVNIAILDPDFRAMGGPVTAGHPYIVGENGPELFVPGRNGTIVPDVAPAGTVGGGPTIHYYAGTQIANTEALEEIRELARRQ